MSVSFAQIVAIFRVGLSMAGHVLGATDGELHYLARSES